MELECHAKINLSLDVIRKRSDGYHDVELIYNEISLYDTVRISERRDGEIRLTCSDSSLPIDDGNIAYRAAELFMSESGIKNGADIDIIKRIPHGAGLAGGSADAAGVLKGLNSIYGNPLETGKLLELGKRLGADVPFCIKGGCAFAEGIGEIMTFLPKPEGFVYLIAKPQASISTAFVYNHLDLSKPNDKFSVRLAAEGIKTGDNELLFKNCGNIMEAVTGTEFPIIFDIKKSLLKSGAYVAMMSGSGTSVFGIFKDSDTAKAAESALQKYDVETWVCK